MATNEMAKGGGIKQSKPQETDSTYSKAIDKQVAGKPVGYRFTDKLAKKLGKKPGTKPTAAEIEKYKNRGVYFETRKNKSDLNPKAKLEMGGENEYAKGGKTKEFLDWNDIIGRKIGSWKATDNNGISILWESNKSPYYFFATPGFDADVKDYPNHLGIEIHEIDYDDLDIRLISRDKDASYDMSSYLKEVKKVIKIVDNYGKNLDEYYFTNDFDMQDSDEHGTYHFAKGGQTAPQRESYSKRGDQEVKAKPVGYRFTEKLANRLGKNVYTKPTQEQVEKYRGKGVYFENRKDKSDINPRAMFEDGGDMEYAKGGQTKSHFIDLDAAGLNDSSFKRWLKNNNISFSILEAQGDAGYNPFVRFAGSREDLKSLIDNYYNNDKETINVYYEQIEKYAKGGQTSPQRESYSKRGDQEVKAKPVGYRFTEKLANRLGKNVYTKPTQEQVEKYRGRGVYFENRKDKSDLNPRAMFEEGGDMEYAKGGVAEHGLQKGDKIIHATKSLILVENDGKLYRINIEEGTREELRSYSFARGGQTAPQRESYSKRGDKEVKAKPVGYRFTKSLAKRLGKNPFTKPTAEQVRKYLGKGVYFENRKDKSDLNPKSMFEQGGDMEYAKGGQTAPQETDSTYSKSIDKRVSGKPVGYRFTNKLAKKLGKNPQTAPKASEIEKYSGKGVYFETRRNKSDLNPKAKLEGGGENEYARGGGVARTSNADSKAYTENHLPFMANNLEGKTLENGDYVVLSYGYYPIWFWHKRTNKWYGNKDKFSVTTAKQISQSRPTYEAEMLSRGEMDNLMSKSIEGKDFKEMGGTLDSFVVAQQ
jgi:hypothetical protein